MADPITSGWSTAASWCERLEYRGKLVLQLHRFEEENRHGRVGNPNDLPSGKGLLLWFEVDVFDAAVARAEALGARVILPHRNPPDGDGGPNHWELWIYDPEATTLCWPAPTAPPTGIGGRRERCRRTLFSNEPLAGLGPPWDCLGSPRRQTG